MENIIVIGYRHEGRDVGKPYGAYARNTKTGKSFYLGSYSSIKRRDHLAPKLLAKKLEKPSSEFKRFMLDSPPSCNPHKGECIDIHCVCNYNEIYKNE